jgi:hypothetical protein
MEAYTTNTTVHTHNTHTSNNRIPNTWILTFSGVYGIRNLGVHGSPLALRNQRRKGCGVEVRLFFVPSCISRYHTATSELLDSPFRYVHCSN